MTHPILVFLAACVVALPATLMLARLAARIGAVSRVSRDRWHISGDVPRLAGPALLLGMAPWLPLTHSAVLAIICGIGAVDDVRRLSPGIKGGALAVAAIIAGYATGSVFVAAALWVACNAVNMLDHADGLAAASAAGAFSVLGSSAGYAGAGACVGFLVFNFPPARVFMGDSGSLTLGAALVLAGSELGIAATAGVLVVPLFDAGFVVTRRLVAGRKPWIGGVDHTGHVLLTSGVPAQVLTPLYGAAAALCAMLVMMPW